MIIKEIKLVEFCAELNKATISVELDRNINLEWFVEYTKSKSLKTMLLGQECLLIRKENKIIHIYSSGMCLFNNCRSFNEGVDFAINFLGQVFNSEECDQKLKIPDTTSLKDLKSFERT